MLPGRATAAGTRGYRDRFARLRAAGHFRDLDGVQLSSIGLGTYLGEDSAEVDQLYQRAVVRAFELGLNVVDSAISYRSQRSERAIGAALGDAFARGVVARDEIVIASKVGYLPWDGAAPADSHAAVAEPYLRAGLVAAEELVNRCHCLAPRYLADQLARSRRNLGLATIDIYYLHNPEAQLAAVTRDEFLRRMRDAFAFLEEAAGDGRIGVYGTATWSGYRRPASAADGLSLAELLAIAREVGGAGHHFRALELPFNLAMPEAFSLRNQDGGRSLLEAAVDAGCYVMSSASILQGRLARVDFGFPRSGLTTSAQHGIQLARSVPGIGTALVGMKRIAHVEENAAVAEVPPLGADMISALVDVGE